MIALALALLLTRWTGAPTANADWFKVQRNAHGEYCCDKSDGHAYYGSYTVEQDGSVTLANGHKLPAWMVLHGPNPTGHAIWWYTSSRDYCFALGTLF